MRRRRNCDRPGPKRRGDGRGPDSGCNTSLMATGRRQSGRSEDVHGDQYCRRKPRDLGGRRVHVVLRRVLASIDLRRLGREHTQVDLLRLDALLPFGRIGTLHVLIVAIAVSLSAFQSLDAELRWVNYSAALAMGIPAGIALLLLPMVGIRQNVRRPKRRPLEALDEAIENANRDLEPDALRYLGDLLRQRESIQHAREWPLDTMAFSRLAIYFVIPPIARVGGALAEILIQAAL